MDTHPYICQDQWVGLEVHRRDSVGVLISSGRIMCWKENDHFQDGTLGEDHVGVTILDIFVGSKEDLMTHAQWNISDCWFPEGRSLKETVDHFASLPDMQDLLAYLGGRAKAPYFFIVRMPRLQQRDSLYVRKIANEEIRKVSSEKYCASKCCQFFLQERTLRVRQLFWVKSFEERCQYGITVGGQLHLVGAKRKWKYIMLEGVEVCDTAWYIIHGIPKSTYHNYIEKYKEGVLLSTHGNKGIKRPRFRTVQVTGTIKAIVESSSDQMPHQMRAIGNRRVDTLKYLLAGTTGSVSKQTPMR